MAKVFVASLSPLKTSAVQEVVNELLVPNKGKIDVQGVDTKSGINEQPVGLDENGIVNIGDNWIDLAVVVLEDESGRTYTSTSTGIVFDKQFVNTAKERGFDKVTVGSVMAAAFGKKCKSTDPHTYLTSGVLPRKDTLVLATRAVIGQKLYSQSILSSYLFFSFFFLFFSFFSFFSFFFFKKKYIIQSSLYIIVVVFIFYQAIARPSARRSEPPQRTEERESRVII